MVHIRFEGRSYQLDAAQTTMHAAQSDAVLRAQAADYLEVPERRLDGYVIDRTPKGDLVIRPEAVYG